MYGDRTYSTDAACRSIFRQHFPDGTPWNHLCILPKGHEEDHECWHGPSCATWTDEDQDGVAQSIGGHDRSGMSRSHELRRDKMRREAA